MSESLLSSRNLAFELYEVLDAEALTQRERFAEHNRETFDAAIATARGIAEELFAPHNRKNDEHEPQYVDGAAVLIPEVEPALRAFHEAGFLNATRDFEHGGMQLPNLLSQACFAHFQSANIATSSYSMLTMGVANLIEAFGNDEQKARYLQPIIDGRFFGTMCLTEPHAGSSLSDIRTKAEPAADGSYRIKGNKIFISGGDQPISENIVHMVLAKLPDAPPGVKGISLFLVPKFHVNADGSLGARNDVTLAGLFHKMGWRGTTSTALNFGDNGECVGYLVGKPHHGLSYMFQMMNEARIGVGMGAVMLGWRGYLASLAYAQDRPQGRLPDSKNPTEPQRKLIEHADVRRMLLAQKAYVEGAYGLVMYAARLVDEHKTHPDATAREEAALLLDTLTPIVKSWPSQWCLEANNLAIQIHGGYGFTREYPVEQFYRDNRLNPIHEGTHGIQAMDLLGRKAVMRGGAGMALLARKIGETIAQAQATLALQPHAQALQAAWAEVEETLQVLRPVLATQPTWALANASVFLEACGHTVLAWVWLEQALVAARALPTAQGSDVAFYQGTLHT
ncbi:MAG: acyl-CoA dehydrogenase, partial [Aquipseudomonas alcaligenes]